jgi:hypothetical protein
MPPPRGLSQPIATITNNDITMALPIADFISSSFPKMDLA